MWSRRVHVQIYRWSSQTEWYSKTGGILSSLDLAVHFVLPLLIQLLLQFISRQVSNQSLPFRKKKNPPVLTLMILPDHTKPHVPLFPSNSPQGEDSTGGAHTGLAHTHRGSRERVSLTTGERDGDSGFVPLERWPQGLLSHTH